MQCSGCTRPRQHFHQKEITLDFTQGDPLAQSSKQGPIFVWFKATACSPHGAISAFTRVFDALWRNAGAAEQPAPSFPDFAALHPGYSAFRGGPTYNQLTHPSDLDN